MTDEPAILDRLLLFYGEASAAEARVYALLPADAAPPGCWLSGAVTGPSCTYAKTLETTTPLVQRSAASGRSDSALLAEARVADPCFWTPELPMLYHARVDLFRGNQQLATTEHAIGIRPLGTRGRRLLFAGRPYVIRAVQAAAAIERSLREYREVGAAMFIECPGDDLCRDASREGVLLIAGLHDDHCGLAAEVRRISRWPAVVAVAIETVSSIDVAIRSEARNVLLAQRSCRGEAVEPAAWADLVICEDRDAVVLAARAAEYEKPVMAFRRAEGESGSSIATLRTQCDALQRDLAGRGDFVGYIV